MSVHVTILRGGMSGPDGVFDSGGMDLLWDRITQLAPYPKITTSIYNWDQYLLAAHHLAQEPLDVARVIVGYSGGGSRATMIAALPEAPHIDLMILYDPSPRWQMHTIGANVRKAITYENSAPLMPSLMGELGGGVLQNHPGGPVIERVPIAEQHLLVQWDERLHQHTLKAIEELLAS
jgi:hypothetical protein